MIAAGGKHFLIGDLPRSNPNSPAFNYNREVHSNVGELRSAEVSIYQFDLNATIGQIISNPTAYGITNTTSLACRDCDSGLNPNPVDIVNNPNEYLLWDGH